MRPHRSAVLLIVLATLVLPRRTHARQLAPADTGSVVQASGSAQLTLQPTRAVITFAVESRAVSAAQAASLNGPKTRRLLAALSAARPAPESVMVIGVSVGPNENEQRGTVVDYQARAMLRLVVTALDSLGRYLDIALASGATEVGDVSFRSDSADVASRRALARAYSQAYGKAQALAEAAGGSLGPLLRVATGPDYAFSGVSSLALSDFASYRSAAVPITAQGVTASASVSATWRFVERH